ncbi:uncharacterized protein EKO05_0007817 [Ascochyta rabiei]|nr:uncharacterized protein EKO05_0007817 [Ascochyta rabiei]UPX17465.1 hypothetical protein EKO05_0007817 [Ascochyta rabiei]
MFIGILFTVAIILPAATASTYKPTTSCATCESRVHECIKMCKDRYEDDMSLACKVACECKVSKQKKDCAEKCGLGCESEIGKTDARIGANEE